MEEKPKSRCPVDHSKLSDGKDGQPSSLWSLFGSSSSSPTGGQGLGTPESQQQHIEKQQQETSSKFNPSGGGCPVDHGRISNANLKASEANKPSFLASLFGWKNEKKNTSQKSDQDIVASLEEAAKYSQLPQPGQSIPLSTHRATSSIPRGLQHNDDEEAPSPPFHQPSSSSSTSNSCTSTELAGGSSTGDGGPQNWVYPSEQQVFNAMKRKGWQGIEETSIPSFLQIHNSVNERSWKQLCDWEQETSSLSGGNNDKDITLVRFQGRPNTLTPKAFILSSLGLAPKPFDRHDWYIDNGVDHEKRYVLDFYMYEDGPSTRGGGGSAGGIPRVEIDVRPAMDTPQAVLARVQRVASDSFPGIATALKSFSSPPSSSPSAVPRSTTRSSTTSSEPGPENKGK